MFVFFKDESGRRAIRPAMIGYVKNNFARRSLVLLMWIPTFLFCVSFNLMHVAFSSLVYVVSGILRWSVHSLKYAFRFPWNDPVWMNHRK